MLASTFDAVYLLCVIIASSFQISSFWGGAAAHPQGSEDVKRCDFSVVLCRTKWSGKRRGVACLTTAVEVFHKPNLSDWQCFTVARIMDETIYTHMQYT